MSNWDSKGKAPFRDSCRAAGTSAHWPSSEVYLFFGATVFPSLMGSVIPPAITRPSGYSSGGTGWLWPRANRRDAYSVVGSVPPDSDRTPGGN